MRRTSYCEKSLKPEHILLTVVVSLSLHASNTRADDYFSPDSIELRGNVSRDIDLSQFRQVGSQAPGVYPVAIYLNNSYVAERDINFTAVAGKLTPELTPKDLIQWGVTENATPAFMQTAADKKIDELEQLLPDSHIDFDFPQHRLNISVPQQYVRRDPQGYVSPDEWDDGLNMLFANYGYSGSTAHSSYRSGTDNSTYLNLRSGANLGAWRLRNYGSYTHSRSGNHWDNISTYLQRDIKTLKSQFIAGESYTQSDVFDSFAFRGLQLYSDDNMLPESLRGFAPIVRGIAASNAQVTIRQNGSIIWQSYVPPGPFVINDLYPTSSSGELEVSILESDGTERKSVQPFSAVAVMQREGRFKYAVTAGNYRSSDTAGRKPAFFQATGIYGLPWTLTVYGGGIVSDNYQSVALGVGKSLGDFGSVSLDGTFARSQFTQDTDTGGSFRFQYSKDIVTSGTTFTLLGYRYSTAGYHDFNEANGDYYDNRSTKYEDDEERAYKAWRYTQTKRSKTQASINQSLGDHGSLYLSAYEQSYWGGDKERSINAGYGSGINGINYSLNYSYSQAPYVRNNDQIVSLSVQIPLDKFLPGSWLNLSGTSNKQRDTTSMVGLSGTALADNNLSWSLQQGYNSQNVDTTGNASVDYKGRMGEYRLGYNYSRQNQQFTYGAQGGVVLHPYGLNLTQPLGETMALVRAKDAGEVKVFNSAGVYTNSHGYAVVPYVSPYHRTSVTLDTATLGPNVDLLGDTRTIVPTNGALALADFPTASGKKVMFRLQGIKVPFGAIANVANNNRIAEGIVDEQQRVWLTGVPEQGTLQVQWASGQCHAPYRVAANQASVLSVAAACH